MTWASVHVYYYDEDKDALVLDAVRPLFAEVGDHVTRAHFLRHWKRGPHLRLCFDTDPDVVRSVLRPAIDRIVGDHLARRPSTVRIDEADRERLHRRLAEAEDESGPLFPWHPDNSVQDAEPESRLHVLGTQESADLLADFHADTTPLIFAMTERIRAGRASRLGLAFDLMLTTAHSLSGVGLLAGFGSFRSHAEAFLCAWPEGRGLRPAWEEHYRGATDPLTSRVRHVVETLESGPGPVPFVRDWVAALEPIRRRAERLIAADRLPLGLGGRKVTGVRDLKQVSPYHRAVAADEYWTRELRSERFALYRTMLNYTYLYLTRLGVTPVQRFRLCHLAANAVEDVYGVSTMGTARR
jgi:hypothetical protein